MRLLVVRNTGDSLDDLPGMLRMHGHETEEEWNLDAVVWKVRNAAYPIIFFDRGHADETTLRTITALAKPDVPYWIVSIGGTGGDLPYAVTENDHWFDLPAPLDSRAIGTLLATIGEIISLRKTVADQRLKVSHLEVVNRVVELTLSSKDDEDVAFLWDVARLVHEKMGYFDVNIFLVNERERQAVLQAYAGGFGEDRDVGYTLQFGEGLVGWVVEHGEAVLAPDVRNEPRRKLGFSFEEEVMAEFAVPVISSDAVVAVIHVESNQLNAFTPEDVMALETIAVQMALAFERSGLSRQLKETYSLSASINDLLPVSILLVNADRRIEYANQTLCETLYVSREDLLGNPVGDYLSHDFVESIDLTDKTREVMDTGAPLSFTNIHHSSAQHPDKILNINIVRVQSGRHPLVMIMIQDVTDFTRKTQQLSIIREISIAMQGVIDRDKLLHMILTGVTAGFAIGFNRAFLFLVDESARQLVGSMGVGPVSAEEAGRVWYELEVEPFTFQEYLKRIDNNTIVRSGLQDIITEIVFDIEHTDNVLTRTVKTGGIQHITDGWTNPDIDDRLRKLIASEEFVVHPLIVKNQVIGVLMVDNAYSSQPITNDMIQQLTMFAAPAAMAIDNTHMLIALGEKVEELEKAYAELEKTHNMLVRHEKLAAIGEVSARLAHEIRNPLATIGGFAKSIPKRYEDRERTIRNANIIIEEVNRLENILSNVLDFTKAGAPQYETVDLNELVRQTLNMVQGETADSSVIIMLNLSGEPLETEVDPSQMKQVIINLIQNALKAMPDGGVLEISTKRDENHYIISIRDTGRGIPEDILDNIFEPFFTTRGDGTGLGMSISQRIVQNHQGRLEIDSVLDAGTTVRILLPVQTPGSGTV